MVIFKAVIIEVKGKYLYNNHIRKAQKCIVKQKNELLYKFIRY